jgi:hypothetical protein
MGWIDYTDGTGFSSREGNRSTGAGQNPTRMTQEQALMMNKV